MYFVVGCGTGRSLIHRGRGTCRIRCDLCRAITERMEKPTPAELFVLSLQLGYLVLLWSNC